MRGKLSRVRSRFPNLILVFIVLAGLVGSGDALAAPNEDPRKQPAIELFVSEGCPHCAVARAFLDELARERPGLNVTIIDLPSNADALVRLRELSRTAGITRPGVPTTRIGNELIVGFDTPETTGARIRAALDHTGPAGPTGEAACGVAETNGCAAPQDDAIEIPWSGRRLSVTDVGLPVFTIVIGLLDGLNPCSIWVLILMISMLATLGDRRTMLAIAGTFVAIQGIAYFAFMAAWLNLFLLVGISRISEIAIAVLAIIAGVINLKDFVAFGRGITLSIPVTARPSIYARLRAILRAERLWPAILGTIVLAILVQIVELLCTAGFPALYTRILTLHQLDKATYYGYLLLYNLMYMLDDIVILTIGVVTLSQHRLQENEGRRLKLVAGLVMLGLGIYLLVPR
ncbi:MAG: glutaredoxin family protein [Sterolibacterium sp.]|jgi:glutaredoxin